MSLKVAFSDIANVNETAEYEQDFLIDAICTDTRTLKPGDTYLAIAGENFDGHDFIQQAIKAGASSVIVQRKVDVSVPQLEVADSVHALGNVARLYRDQLSAVVIGITGSNGKTTVKGMLQSVCEQQGSTTATVANNNNMIGAPLTLLSASRDDSFVVVEMGTSEVGEIPYLMSVVNPDVSVITNVSESHLSGLGSRDDVFIEKSAIIAELKDTGIVIINADDSYAERIKEMSGAHKVVRYGFDESADVHLVSLIEGVVEIASPNGMLQYSLKVPGDHNLSNSMAALALAQAAGINNAAIVAGLENYTGTRGRLQVSKLPRNITLLDDTYNANPASSYAALDVLQAYGGRKLFAYGGMAELGELSEELHRNVGVKARGVGVDQLYIYGNDARAVYEAFDGEKFYFDEIDDLSRTLLEQLCDGDAVLVKGSRRYRMERVSQYLQGGLN